MTRIFSGGGTEQESARVAHFSARVTPTHAYPRNDPRVLDPPGSRSDGARSAQVGCLDSPSLIAPKGGATGRQDVWKD